MAQQNGSKRHEQLRERAKELLTCVEYERLKNALKIFSKTRSVEQLCLDLLKIVNSPAKVDILAEVRQSIPKGLRNKFTLHCKELITSESQRAACELAEKKRRKGEKEKENGVSSASPLKRKKQVGEKPKALKLKNVVSQEKKKYVVNNEEEQNHAKLKDLKTRNGSYKNNNSASLAGVQKVVVLERGSSSQGFGFRIRGGTSTDPLITIAAVAKSSPAEERGLKVGDRVIRVNGKHCQRDKTDRAEVIRAIKAADTLHMLVVTSEPVDEGQSSEESRESRELREEECGLTTVVIHPGHDGWLGCCVRGGADYTCDVQVISVDDGSPAERAGLKKGDVIVKINGISTKNMTHIQAVRLVLSSGRGITFSTKPGKRSKKSSRQQSVEDPPTPLRISGTEPNAITPPGTPSLNVPPPDYQHALAASSPFCCHGVQSPSQLPLHEMKLNPSPPPPYTADVPSEHKLLEKGDSIKEHEDREIGVNQGYEIQGGTGRDAQNGLGSGSAVDMGQEIQDASGRELALEISSDGSSMSCQSSCNIKEAAVDDKSTVALSQHSSAVTRDRGEEKQQEALEGEQALKNCPFEDKDNNLVVMTPSSKPLSSFEASSGNDPALPRMSPPHNSRESFLSQIIQFNKGRLKQLPERPNSNITSSDTCPPLPLKQLVEERSSETSSDNGLSSPRIMSPSNNSRMSFLDQIRQFNKAKLKQLPERPDYGISIKGQRKASAVCENVPLHEQQNEEENDPVEINKDCEDGAGLLSALTKALENRARVLNTTLSSDDSGDSDEEWDL